MKKKGKVEERKIQIIAVPYQKDFRKFGAAVDAAMNSLADAGRVVSHSQHPGGVLITGVLMPRNPLADIFLGVVDRADPPEEEGRKGEAAGISERAAWVLRRCISGLPNEALRKPEVFTPAIEWKVPDILKSLVEEGGQTTEDLHEIAEELEDEAVSHDCGHTDCSAAKISALVAEQIKKYLHQTVS